MATIAPPAPFGKVDIVVIKCRHSAYDLQNAMVVGIGLPRESIDDLEVHLSVRGGKVWLPAAHLELVTKKPSACPSNQKLCNVSTLEDNRAFLKHYAKWSQRVECEFGG